MLTGRIIICIVFVSLVIQFLPVHRTNDYISDDTSEVCINIVANDDGGNLFDLTFSDLLTLDQQIISFNRFYTNCKIIPGFPVCNYSSFLTDVITPPPDKAAC